MHYVKVAAANAGGAYFDVDFARLWRVQLDFFYGQGLSYFPENSSFHGAPPWSKEMARILSERYGSC